MDCKKQAFIVGVCSALIVGILLVSIVYTAMKSSYEIEAIRHKAAYYHPETGDFMWITIKQKENK